MPVAASVSRGKKGARAKPKILGLVAELGAESIDVSGLGHADRVLMAGQILKRGSREDSAFQSRWVTVTPTQVSYAKFRDTRVIDVIHMHEVIGLAFEDGGSGNASTHASKSERGDDELSHPGTVSSKEDNERAHRRNQLFWRPRTELKKEKKQALKAKISKYGFALFTNPEGYYRGRVFSFQCEDTDAQQKWTETISRILDFNRMTEIKNLSSLDRVRKRVRWFYVGDRSQIVVAAAISFNFIANMAQSQMGRRISARAEAAFENIDLVFTLFFSAELLVNLCATLVIEFVSDPWNWFDTVVVAVSVASILVPEMPGVTVMRMLRSFRVFRLFRRVKSLRKIVVALGGSLIPVSNAFAILLLVTSIYSIIFVTFFGDVDPELFGSLFPSLFSLFQAMTGDNWSEHCRELMSSSGQGILVSMLYVSFMLIVSLVLVNVVIAVLLDEFGKASRQEDADTFEEEQSKSQHQPEAHERAVAPNPSDPFTRMAKRLTRSGDMDELEAEINAIWYDIVDRSQQNHFVTEDHDHYMRLFSLKSWFRKWRFGGYEGWALTGEDFQRGVKRLRNYLPPLIISRQQFYHYVRPFAGNNGMIGRKGFQGMLQTSMRNLQMHALSRNNSNITWERETITAVLMGTMGLLRAELRIKKSRGRAGRGNTPVMEDAAKRNVDKMMDRLMTEILDMDRRLLSFQNFSEGLDLPITFSGNPKVDTWKSWKSAPHLDTTSAASSSKMQRSKSIKDIFKVSKIATQLPGSLRKPAETESRKTVLRPLEKELRRIFLKYDEDSSGAWEIAEMEKFLDTLAVKDSLGHPKSVFHGIDQDKSGVVEFDEFYDWYMRKLGPGKNPHMPTKKDLNRIFNKFDPDHTCVWKVTQLEQYLDNLTEKEELGDAQIIMNALDLGRGEEIDLDKFVDWWYATFALGTMASEDAAESTHE